MFEGGKGVYAEGFGTLDEHRVSLEPGSPGEPGLHFECLKTKTDMKL